MSTDSSPVWSALSRELSDAADRVTRSIVQVHGRSRPASGIVWARDRVLSTSHSVEWEDGVRVRRHDGTVLPAEIAGHDPASDLVVLRVGNLDSPPLPHAGAAARAGDLALITGRAWNGRSHARLVALTGVAGPLQSAHGPRLDRVITLPLSPYAGFSGSALAGPDGTLLGVATAGPGARPCPRAPRGRRAADRRSNREARRHPAGLSRRGDPARAPASSPARRSAGRARASRARCVSRQPGRGSGRARRRHHRRRRGCCTLDAGDLLALLGPERVGQPLSLDSLRGASRESRPVVVGERITRR